MAIINNSFSALGVFFLESFINQVFSCLSRNNKHQTTIMTSSSSPVLAGLPGDCCIKTKFKHTGPGAGKIITIAGIQTYISEPKETKGPKKIIFFLSDVFGPFLPHNEYIQDYFAQQGTFLYLLTPTLDNSQVSITYLFDLTMKKGTLS